MSLAAMAAGLTAQVQLARENLTGAATASSLALARVSEWVRSQPDTGPVMAQQAAIVHRLSGRHVIPFPVTSDGQFVADVIRNQQVSYLLMTPEPFDYFRPTQRVRLEALRRSAPDCCQLVARETGYEVYRVIR